jgi:hypothetical protein
MPAEGEAPEVFCRVDRPAEFVLWAGVILFPLLIVTLFFVHADSSDNTPQFTAPFAVATLLLVIGLMQHKRNRLERRGALFTLYSWTGKSIASFEKSDVVDIRFTHRSGGGSLWTVILPTESLTIPDAFVGVRAVMEEIIQRISETERANSSTQSVEA